MLLKAIPAIVAAGDGRAAKAVYGQSKVYLELGGRALVAHVVMVLQDVPEVSEVWVVGNAELLREVFDREKLERAVNHALRKRPVEGERIERMITGIVRRLESLGENEVPSDMIGELVMQALASLDKVAYIRFASVYKNFREARDFETFAGGLSSVEQD